VKTETLIGRYDKTVAKIGDQFTLSDGMKAVGTITVRADVAYNQTGYVTIEKLVNGTWETAFTDSFTVRLARVGMVETYNLSDIDLGPGTYRVATGLSTGISLVYVKTDMDVILTDAFKISAAPVVRGNFLTNDDFDIGGGRVVMKNPLDGDSLSFNGVRPIVLTGEYGTLTVYRNGDYEYKVAPNAPYFKTPVVDSFEYELVLPNGQASPASIEITLTPQGAGVGIGARMSSVDDLLALYLGDDGQQDNAWDSEADASSQQGGDMPPLGHDDITYAPSPLGQDDQHAVLMQ
jgi:hypothetical protein